MPHHYVLKDSTTTPIKIVFDCSAKENINKLSLNDCLQTGTCLLTDMVSVLTRFRIGKYAATADIRKAYFMIKLA